MIRAVAQLGQQGRCLRLNATLSRFLHRPALAAPYTRIRAVSSVAKYPSSSNSRLIGFPQQRNAKLPLILCRSAFTASDIITDVGVMIEGDPKVLRYILHIRAVQYTSFYGYYLIV